MVDNGSSWSFESVLGLFCLALIVGAIVAIVVILSRKSSKETKDYMTNSLSTLKANSFIISNQYTYGHLMMFIDDTNKRWSIVANHIPMKIYDYEDLNSYDLDEDGNTLTQEVIKGRVTGFKGYGLIRPSAVVKTSSQQFVKNTCNKLQLRIYVDDVKSPQLVIDFIANEVDKSSHIYRASYQKANEVVAILHYIKNNSSDAASVDNQIQAGSAGNDTKECPMCAERIKAKAVVCRFCGYQFGNVS